MKGQRIWLLALLLPSLLLTESCRKGPNDPVFSLRTRQARLTGDWTVKTAQWTVNDTTWTHDGTNTVKEYDGTAEEPLNQTLTFGFEKDGAYYRETETNFPDNYQNNGQPGFTETIRHEGFWNWAGGEGETPGKSRLLLLDAKVTRSTSVSANIEVIAVEGQTDGFLFDIDKLMNQEMTLLYDRTTSGSINQITETGDFELEKD